MRGAKLLWTVGGLGLSPIAPGTMGTLAGVALVWLAGRSASPTAGTI